MVHVKPEYPGGENAIIKFIQENIKYPQKAIEEGITGRTFIMFIIDKDGKVTNVKIARQAHPLLDEEGIMIISLMPDWKPGMIDGRPVKVNYVIPINFRLSDKDEL